MITLQALVDHLNLLLEPSAIDDYCPNGLQVEGAGKIGSIVTAVSASLETIESAVEAGVDALIVHHGIYWKGLSPCVTGVLKRKIELLLGSGISLLAYHLPLDVHREVGNNWAAARDLGWDGLEEFGSYGVRGEFSARSIDHFVKELEGYYEHAAHAALGGPKEVRSAALISGGSHRSLSEAVAAGVDCFITGSFDEPQWHIAREEGIHFLALGHSATERVGPRALAFHLGASFGIEADFLDLPNPF